MSGQVDTPSKSGCTDQNFYKAFRKIFLYHIPVNKQTNLYYVNFLTFKNAFADYYKRRITYKLGLHFNESLRISEH